VSLLENALKKLQGTRAAAVPSSGSLLTPPRVGGPQPSVIPVARRKKVAFEGPKHHVEQADLIRGGLLASLDQAVPVADQFRKIKRPLIANAFTAEPRTEHANVIMITSALPSAGKTFCSVNLAVSVSLERDLNVLLVDADVAKPHITREFGLADAPGLIDWLLEDGSDINDLLVRTDLNEIQVLPAGRSHPQATELLASERMSRLVQELATRYSDRVVLLDSPPLLITSEAQALASQVGQITLVVEAGRTSQQQLMQTLETLDEGKAVNIILNKSRSFTWSRSGDYSGDYGHYGYENN
jgi:exopolysaccharide/PEP-CTERM locus tyrosine autokinase